MTNVELFSESSENYLVKVMFNRPETIVEIAQALKSSDFHFLPFRYIFNAIKVLSLKGEVTAEGIMSYLESENKEAFFTLQNLGGASAINTLQDASLPARPSVDNQIQIVKSFSYRRNALVVGDKIKYAAESNLDVNGNKQFENVNQLDEHLKEMVYTLADNLNSQEETKTIGSKIASVKEQIASKEFSGIDIGFIYPIFNSIIKRLRNGALYVFGAPEKVGKSTFMLDIGWNVAKVLGVPVAYGDTEMTTEEQLLRLCSKVSGVTEDKISDDLLSEEERERVENAWNEIETVPFYHFNANELTNEELDSKVKLLQMKHGIGLFIYDYVKIQSHEAEKGRLDMIMASKIDTLKEKIAKQCGIPVITSGQMYALSDERGKNHKFAETSHFTKLGDVIGRLDRANPADPSAFGSHYFELIAGRKVKQKDVGRKVEFDFHQEIHRIRELKA